MAPRVQDGTVRLGLIRGPRPQLGLACVVATLHPGLLVNAGTRLLPSRHFDAGEPRRRDLFIVKLVDHPPQPLGKLKGGRADDRLLARHIVLLDERGEHQPAPERIDRGRHRIAFGA